MKMTVFFDVLCPFAWRASRWLDLVVAQKPEVQIDWRFFTQLPKKGGRVIAG
jgi:predicted DsbA family dithiol-disulfide isomerase